MNILIKNNEKRQITIPGSTGQKKTALSPGYNELSIDVWLTHKDCKAIKYKLDNKLLEVEFKENSESKKHTKKIHELKTRLGEHKATLEKTNKAILKETVEDKIAILVTEKKETEKNVEELNNQLTETQVAEIAAQGDFNLLSHEEKENVINNTYNVKVLEKWKADDGRAEIRNLILDQMKKIKKNKK